MPREDRKILFDYHEVYKALYALAVQKEIRKPPPGIITAAGPAADATMIAFTITNPQEKGSTHKLEFSRDFLAAALMLYCRSQSIPISKRARKSVEFAGTDVILRLEI